MAVENETIALTFQLKAGTDVVKWRAALGDMILGTFLEEPDDEINNRSFVVDSVQYLLDEVNGIKMG